MLAQGGNWGFRGLLCAGAVPSVLRPIHHCWLSLAARYCGILGGGILGGGGVPLCFNQIFIYYSLYLFDGDQSHCWLKRAPSLKPLSISERYHMSDSSQVPKVPGQPTNQRRSSCSLFGIRLPLPPLSPHAVPSDPVRPAVGLFSPRWLTSPPAALAVLQTGPSQTDLPQEAYGRESPITCDRGHQSAVSASFQGSPSLLFKFSSGCCSSAPLRSTGLVISVRL